jgi:hypothetical protein
MTKPKEPKKPRQPAKPSTNGRKPPRPRQAKPMGEEPQDQWGWDQPLPNSGPQQPDPPEYQPGASRAGSGRLASEIPAETVTWLVPDLVPCATLIFAVGRPSSGKSTFGAWLCGQAVRPCILPGYEESVGSTMLPRLMANRVMLPLCRILDDRVWTLPHDRGPLTAVLQQHRADLLWIDPVDSYVGSDAERSGVAVREALESLCRLARDVPCAVVCARHPGKAAGNLCPGYKEWLAVPREVLEITHDRGPPERRFLRRTKDPWSLGRTPREFTLLGEPGEPKRFSLGPQVEESEAEAIDLPDPVERSMLDQAREMILALLAEGRMDSSAVRSAAEKEGIKDGILGRAKRRLGVKVVREGVGREHKSYWALSHTLTPSTLATPPL